jgi:hypothetical protein
MGDHRGIVETATTLKVATPTLGAGLWVSFSNLSWAEYAAIGTLIYTIILTFKLLYNWIRYGK